MPYSKIRDIKNYFNTGKTTIKYLFHVIISFALYTSVHASALSSDDLDLNAMHQTAHNARNAFLAIENGNDVNLKPTMLIIYRKSLSSVTDWEYPLELDLNSPQPKLSFDDKIPSQASLRDWSYIKIHSAIYLRKSDGKIIDVGSTQQDVHRGRTDQDIPYIYLINIYIQDKYQAKGYGTAAASILRNLLSTLFPFARKVELVVDSENPKVAKMANKFGFDLTPESKDKLREEKISEEAYFKDCRLIKKLRFAKEV